MRLVKDSNLEELEPYWTISAKGEACADGPPPSFPPDCTTYRVTATFVGRIDGVSKEVHAAQHSGDHPDDACDHATHRQPARPTGLKRNPQPQPYGAAVIDALLRKAAVQHSEQRVAVDIAWDCRVNRQ